MKKETEKQIKDAILQLSKRILYLEDIIEKDIKRAYPPEVIFEAIKNSDGTLTPITKSREIIID